jgi:hypothetical protein
MVNVLPFTEKVRRFGLLYATVLVPCGAAETPLRRARSPPRTTGVVLISKI